MLNPMYPQIPLDADRVRACLKACAMRSGTAFGIVSEPDLIDESLGYSNSGFTSSATYVMPCNTPIGKATIQMIPSYYSSDIRRMDIVFALYLDEPAQDTKRIIPINLTWKSASVNPITTHRRAESGRVELFNMHSELILGHASYFLDPSRPDEGQLTEFRVVH